MPRRKVLGSAIFVPILIGSIGLMNLMNKPRFAGFHNVDVLQLLATGMCYGVALCAFLGLFVKPRKD